jgi:hypothetical protein
MSYRTDFLLVGTHEGVDISGEFADARGICKVYHRQCCCLVEQA